MELLRLVGAGELVHVGPRCPRFFCFADGCVTLGEQTEDHRVIGVDLHRFLENRPRFAVILGGVIGPAQVKVRIGAIGIDFEGRLERLPSFIETVELNEKAALFFLDLV